MSRALRCAVAIALTVAGAIGSSAVARAAVTDSSGTNVQDGNNRSTANQGGASKSGDSVGGQVTGVVSSGRTSVDARNTSKDSSVTSGDAKSSNSASSFTGLNSSETTTVTTADITGVVARNVQDGDNRTTYSQSSSATTGDGVAGEVIGAVTAAGGSSSIVAANRSENVDVTTGDATSETYFAAFTGLDGIDETLTLNASDLNSVCNTTDCDNAQDGNNRATARQTSAATTGDGVAGQVIGAVSAGASSIDANNVSTDSSVDTGDAGSSTSLASFVGLNNGGPATITASDVVDSCGAGEGACDNLQDGSNTATYSQTSAAKTGDGVAGEVIGAVTSAGGSASIVAANTTTNSDVTTGDATSADDAAAFVGLNQGGGDLGVLISADVAGSCIPDGCENLQSGSNRLTLGQTAMSATGDGVAGQVLGVVSAGAASVDATNHTDDSTAETGDAHADNSAQYFVGLADTDTITVTGADVSGSRADNLQDGSNRKTATQSADATSGDAVAGQVSGVVTSAGGTASVVLANTSTGIDALSGDGVFANSDAGFVGLEEGEFVTIGG